MWLEARFYLEIITSTCDELGAAASRAASPSPHLEPIKGAPAPQQSRAELTGARETVEPAPPVTDGCGGRGVTSTQNGGGKKTQETRAPVRPSLALERPCILRYGISGFLALRQLKGLEGEPKDVLRSL